jgi:hypothetical protein
MPRLGARLQLVLSLLPAVSARAEHSVERRAGQVACPSGINGDYI